jgi:NAD(P)-dependent dehydrogenase (short-subunit alcohol dehydrogenase family)
MQRFDGKAVLITGAASGIGRATAERLASEGAQLLLCDVQDEAAGETADLCRKSGAEVRALHCDVGNDDQVTQAVEACVKHYGKLDVLCNVAGILKYGHLTDFDVKDFQRVIDINLTGTFRTCKAALPHLLESGGNIVNTASTAGEKGLPYGGAYCASKGGVLALTRSIAVEFGDRGVRANCVCPGSIVTAMTSSSLFPDDIDIQKLLRHNSMRGPDGPEVVASVIAMLASDDGRHINGEQIRMDGAALA